MNPLLLLLQRARQERDSLNSDALPNPLAGRAGPDQVRYNPLRDVPVAGGAINHAINIPLHAVGLVGEGAGHVGQVGAGAGAALLGALIRAQRSSAGPAIAAASQAVPFVGNINNAVFLAGLLGRLSPNGALEEASQAYQDEGGDPIARALAANEAAKRADPVRGTLSEMAANPLNFAGGIGEIGRALEAAGQAPRVARALKGAALAGEIANRAPLAPLALIPRARKALLAAPEFLRGAEGAGQAASPALAAAREALAALPARDLRPPEPPPVQLHIPGTRGAGEQLALALPDPGAPPPPPLQMPLRAGEGLPPPPPLARPSRGIPEEFDPARFRDLRVDPGQVRGDQQLAGFPRDRIDLGGTQVHPADLNAAAREGLSDIQPGMSLNAVAPALGRTLGGATLGGAVGAGLGAATNGDDRLGGAARGAEIGALLGGNAGAAMPLLRQATIAGLHAAAAVGGESAFAPEGILAGHEAGVEAMRAAKGAKGAKLPDLPAAADNFWRAQVTRTVKNWAQDAANVAVLVREFGREFGASTADVARSRVQLRGNLSNPDKVARYGDLGTQLQDLGQEGLIDQKKGLADLLGVGQIADATSHGTQLSGGQRIAMGAGVGLASGVKTVNPLAPAVNAVTGYYAPYLDAFFGTLNTLQHDAPRVAFLDRALARDVPQLADEFLANLQAQGANVAALAGRGGRFTPADVAALAGQQAGAEWGTLTEGLIRSHAERIAGIFGDFRDKGAAATLGDKAIRVVGRVFPFASWSLRYAPTLAEIAARHPIVTVGIIKQLAADAERAKKEGRRGYTVGTIPISTETPVLGGAIARPRLAFQQGETRLNPIGLLTGPYGGQLAAGMEEQPADATGYQKVTGALAPLGLSPHPAIQSLAYVTGQDYKAPGALSRTAGMEGLPDIAPVLIRAGLRLAGQPGKADGLPDMMQLPSGRAALDQARSIVSKQGASSSDPATRRYAELVLARTQKPLSDPSNRGYLETIGDRDNALWQMAVIQSKTAGAVSNATGMVSPVQTTGQTTQARAAQSSAPLPYSLYQIRKAPPALQPAMLQANARATANSPASATYAGASGADREWVLLRIWDQEHQGLARTAPKLYDQRRKEYAASLR